MAEELPEHVLEDLTKTLGERIAVVMEDTLQLIDDPKQCAQVAEGFAAASILIAAEIVRRCYEADTGNRLARGKVIKSVLAFCFDFHKKDWETLQ